MSTTRRTVLGAALAAPLLGQFTATAAGAVDRGADDGGTGAGRGARVGAQGGARVGPAGQTRRAAQAGRLGTVTEGWVEVRWTAEAQAQLDRYKAVVEAIAPARLVRNDRGTAVRLPVRSAEGDPSPADLPKAHGEGALDGGVTLSTSEGTFRVVNLAGAIEDGLASGRCEVGGADMGHRSAFRCGLAEGKLTADPVPAGQPMKVRLSEVPLRATQEVLDALTASCGPHSVTVDTVLAYVTAEGVYTPPPARA
ncbi:hypothetical protein [Kitasatospora sp. NPDC096140]|uniref:hypothetical protein n=1 Tax=Kitasatospora sp. NPDC096140 TaxID=3155425 RepID=UPI0033239DF9